MENFSSRIAKVLQLLGNQVQPTHYWGSALDPRAVVQNSLIKPWFTGIDLSFRPQNAG